MFVTYHKEDAPAGNRFADLPRNIKPAGRRRGGLPKR